VFDEADFALSWPVDLFVREATRLVERTDDPRRDEKTALLLQEAFVGLAAHDRFEARTTLSTSSIAATLDAIMPTVGEPVTAIGYRFVRTLLGHEGELHQRPTRRGYFAERVGPNGRGLTIGMLKTSFARLITRMYEAGYLDHRIPRGCVDGPQQDTDPSRVLAEHLEIGGLWPLEPDGWPEELFYSLVEVLHDLVARPQHRWWHDFSSCGWHYSDFNIDTARQLYRFQVNELLERSAVPYCLADSGEDEGRLVVGVDAARGGLVVAVTERADAPSREKVRHAIALFRSRDATIEDRRSAVVALAGVLEARKALLKRVLTNKDESDLFRVANEFDVRHHNDRQRSDYDPMFLDWMFWWYLATVELTDRILDRQDLP